MTYDNTAEDILGYSRILLDNIEECNRVFGTDAYKNAVQRLRHSVLNLKNGPQLRDTVEMYVQTTLQDEINRRLDEWKALNPDMADDLLILQSETEMIEGDCMILLHDFIVQLLADNECIKNIYGVIHR